MTEPAASVPRPRFAVLDIARGVAIIAMVIYHFCWDLSYLRFISANVGFDLGWVIFGRLVLTGFLILVGIGLVLGHGRGIRWKAFWKRWIFLVTGALVVTAGTLAEGLGLAVVPHAGPWPVVITFTLPQAFIYFGVLHAIALSSLLALPFLRAPLVLVIVAAAIVILLPALYSNPLFDLRQISWIGFWVEPPPSNDLVSVFPWFGMVLLGVIGARMVLASGLAASLAAIQPVNRPARWLARLGRWSLVIYLVHQPILLGILFPLAGVLHPEIAMREDNFIASCHATCQAGGTSAELCVTYCQCGLQSVIDNDLWNAIYTGMVSADEQAKLDESTRQCSALIYPVAPSAP
ncbi:heparan-alpha-glucosaminide N-acetyltransferase [uncultured Devosia sp.]|uniref:heparan-alpha-glucosaminide N-acetyltransferase n=1 Tax=uncultured Devosia sp. TaxID=211434 RepID=UPI0035CB62B8